MFLKISIAILFLFSFICTSVSHADEQILRKTAKKEFAHESLRELEEEMESEIDDILFPVLFSKYITDCKRNCYIRLVGGECYETWPEQN